MLLLCLDVLAYGFRMRPTHGKDRVSLLPRKISLVVLRCPD